MRLFYYNITCELRTWYGNHSVTTHELILAPDEETATKIFLSTMVMRGHTEDMLEYIVVDMVEY